jgi:hypothetical protein
MEERFIDKFINSRIDEEDEIILPEYINLKVEEALNSLPLKKKPRKKKLSTKAAGIFLASLLCFGAAFHTYAEELFNSISQLFSKQTYFMSEEHLKYASHVEQKAVDKEIEIGVTDVVCDDNNITLGYYIKNGKKIKYGPQVWGERFCVDGKEVETIKRSSLTDEIDKNTYAILQKMSVDKLPEKFTLEWSITNISGVDGKWDFKFIVDKGEIDKNSKIIEVNRTEKIGAATYKIGKVKYTPIETRIELTGIGPVDNPQPSFKEEFAYKPAEFVVTNEKGYVLGTTGGYISNIVDDKREINYELNVKAKELPKTLNLIPYKTEAISSKAKHYSIKGQEAIEIVDEAVGKFMVSSIERNSDTLTLKLRAQVDRPIVQMPDIGLKGLLPDYIGHNQDRRQLANLLSSGEEVELKFTGLKKWKGYKLYYQNSGARYILDEDNKITIPLD